MLSFPDTEKHVRCHFNRLSRADMREEFRLDAPCPCEGCSLEQKADENGAVAVGLQPTIPESDRVHEKTVLDQPVASTCRFWA